MHGHSSASADSHSVLRGVLPTARRVHRVVASTCGREHCCTGTEARLPTHRGWAEFRGEVETSHRYHDAKEGCDKTEHTWYDGRGGTFDSFDDSPPLILSAEGIETQRQIAMQRTPKENDGAR